MGLRIDILVNNAGLGENPVFETSNWNRTRQILAANVMAAVQLTHALVPPMVRRGHGAVLNIGSGAGHATMPNAAVYTGSKHFIRVFSESLRAQLKETGVIVCEAARSSGDGIRPNCWHRGRGDSGPKPFPDHSG